MPARCRRFTLADAILFIAATAVGCAGVRALRLDPNYHLVGSCADDARGMDSRLALAASEILDPRGGGFFDSPERWPPSPPFCP